MKLDLKNPIVQNAIASLKEEHGVLAWKELEHMLEKEHKCKIVYEDAYGINGHLEMPEDKYMSWFVIKFGDAR